MRCSKCGAEVAEGKRLCPQCNAELSDVAPDSARPKSVLAILSLISGVATITPFFGGLFGIGAVIFGIIALNQIACSRGKVTGKGLAIAGIALGGILVLLIYGPTYLGLHVRSKIERARSDIRALAKALESYAADQNAYPPITSLPQPGNEWQGTAELWLLTTPLAYINQLPKDPFSPNREEFYVFANLKPGLSPIPEEKCRPLFEQFGAWILAGAGPDEDLDLDLLLIADDRSGATFCNTVYDPTNGTLGGGDILMSRKIFH